MVSLQRLACVPFPTLTLRCFPHFVSQQHFLICCGQLFVSESHTTHPHFLRVADGSAGVGKTSVIRRYTEVRFMCNLSLPCHVPAITPRVLTHFMGLRTLCSAIQTRRHSPPTLSTHHHHTTTTTTTTTLTMSSVRRDFSLQTTSLRSGWTLL